MSKTPFPENLSCVQVLYSVPTESTENGVLSLSLANFVTLSYLEFLLLLLLLVGWWGFHFKTLCLGSGNGGRAGAFFALPVVDVM